MNEFERATMAQVAAVKNSESTEFLHKHTLNVNGMSMQPKIAFV